MKNRYLTAKELSERLGVSTGTLANWRSQGKGVPYVRFGGVRYPIEEVEKFETQIYKGASL